MTNFLEILSPTIRRARTPLSAGAIVFLGIWILLSGSIPNNSPSKGFGHQIITSIDFLGPVSVISIAILVIGILGSFTIQISDNIITTLVLNCARKFNSSFVFGKPIAALFPEFSEEHSFQLVKTWVQKETWRSATEAYRTKFTYDQVEETLRDQPQLHILVSELVDATRNDPISPFRGIDNANYGVQLDNLDAEISYRKAISVPLIFLSISTAIAYNPLFLFATVPCIMFYVSTIRSQNRLYETSTDWLLRGYGESTEMSNVRYWLNKYAPIFVHQYTENGRHIPGVTQL